MTAQNDIEARLAELLDMLKDEEQRQVCYPVNQSFDYSALIPFLSHSLNNVGDPFHRTNYLANTHQFEREVILHFAQLTGLDPDDAWATSPRAAPKATCTACTWPGNFSQRVCSASLKKPTTPSSRTLASSTCPTPPRIASTKPLPNASGCLK